MTDEHRAGVDHDLDHDQLDDDLDFPTSQVAAFEAAVRSVPALPRDRAVIALARHYAAILDDATDRLSDADPENEARDLGRYVTIIAKIGPRYEATLDKLGMSPGARPASRTGEPHGVDPASTALAQLQSGGTAPGVDPSAHLHEAVAEALSDD